VPVSSPRSPEPITQSLSLQVQRDVVTMTVFITDVRNGTRFTEIRKEIFKEKFPASALITVSGLAQPGMTVEVQAIAVIGDK